jgi:hypothetical protein
MVYVAGKNLKFRAFYAHEMTVVKCVRPVHLHSMPGPAFVTLDQHSRGHDNVLKLATHYVQLDGVLRASRTPAPLLPRRPPPSCFLSPSPPDSLLPRIFVCLACFGNGLHNSGCCRLLALGCYFGCLRVERLLVRDR